jgi:hypothetical protein
MPVAYIMIALAAALSLASLYQCWLEKSMVI